MSSRVAYTMVLLIACSTRDSNLANSRQGSLDDGGRGPAVTDAGAGFSIDDAGVVYCGSAPCACSDGRDNDGDGYVDGFDPECTGASDNFEDSFATGAHGEDKTAKCEDCFFDANSGAGDGCRRARSCALDGTSSSGNGSCRACAVDTSCSDSCGPLVPNGCDCFGCCGVWQGTTVSNILLGSPSCTTAVLADPLKCTPCIQAQDCMNPCGPCELCAGRRVSDLPATCATSSEPGFTCDQGEVCHSTSDCGSLRYCQQGCCIEVGI
ncbi:MAG: hypothetical protein JWN04_273 [Myxococcaceae bacterium]|nr:hypothetical protein [Myxococcaceae bacterium]